MKDWADYLSIEIYVKWLLCVRFCLFYILFLEIYVFIFVKIIYMKTALAFKQGKK